MKNPDPSGVTVDKIASANWLKITWRVVIYIFALIGFILVAGYFAMRLGLTNEKGVIDNQESSFMNSQSRRALTNHGTTTAGRTGDDFNVLIISNASTSPAWTHGEEWQVLKSAITRDKDVIDKAAKDTNVDPRLIIAVLIPEQLRLFNDNRELFKKVFAPLQVLVNQNQFSWGIMGIKQETAIAIENHLKDPTSPYYLGKQYEHLLDFKSANIDSERFARITNENDHYYAYLYAALYLKQIMNQWKNAGYDISNRPEIIATLYNIGFDHSRPNPDPHSGGALISIDGESYSYGTLAQEFFYSAELREYFP